MAKKPKEEVWTLARLRDHLTPGQYVHVVSRVEGGEKAQLGVIARMLGEPTDGFNKLSLVLNLAAEDKDGRRVKAPLEQVLVELENGEILVPRIDGKSSNDTFVCADAGWTLGVVG